LFLLNPDLEKLSNAVSDGSDDPDHPSDGPFVLDYDCEDARQNRQMRESGLGCAGIRGSDGLAAGDSELEGLRQ